MKGKFLLNGFVFSVFAPILAASVISVSAAAQVTKPAADAPVDFQHYEVWAAAAYSGANQVKGSSALVGADVGVDAKLRRWFGGTAEFGYYTGSHGVATPTVTTFLAGPEFYIPSDNLTGFLHVLFGGSHTGNVGAKPDVSFTTAVGGGFEYAFSKRLSVRVAGDAVLSSFVLDPGNLGYSPHERVNPRATGGIAYHF